MDIKRLFITQNRNVNATIAKESNVIEIVASNIDQLLEEIDGRNVTTATGIITLQTKNASGNWCFWIVPRISRSSFSQPRM